MNSDESIVVVVVKDPIPKQEWRDHLVQASREIKSDNFYKNILQNKNKRYQC